MTCAHPQTDFRSPLVDEPVARIVAGEEYGPCHPHRNAALLGDPTEIPSVELHFDVVAEFDPFEDLLLSI